MAQFHCVARGNGWNEVQGVAQLTAAPRGTALEVLTMVPSEGVTLEDLHSARKNRFGMDQQSEVVKAQLSGRKRRSQEPLGELAHDIRRLVGIAHANMPPEYREEIALDHFLRAIGGTDVGAMLTYGAQRTSRRRLILPPAGRQPEHRLEGLGGMRWQSGRWAP